MGYGCGGRITGLAKAPGGKIAASGGYVSFVNFNSKNQMLTMRFNANGTFDTSFSGDGFDIVSIAPSFFTDTGASVAVQADGKIVSFGWTDQSSVDLSVPNHDFLFARYGMDGVNFVRWDSAG